MVHYMTEKILDNVHHLKWPSVVEGSETVSVQTLQGIECNSNVYYQ